MVRMAVATLESVFSIPIFANIAVSPANIAEPNANTSHITHLPFIFSTLILIYILPHDSQITTSLKNS